MMIAASRRSKKMPKTMMPAGSIINISLILFEFNYQPPIMDDFTK
jgi:hypothetical protein